ncbi:helix-turn-helix domain-containing protein [Streptomyces xanthochromogenes]|uniref:helix-turn-helix domain-containing protein n=1 Tax=Streptomyces xanthochromogenes TaxID=67384 RepID=UPI00381043B9
MHQAPTTLQVDGAALRERRKAAGVDLSELAESAGISRRYLSHLENGTRTRMSPARHTRLFKALAAAENRPVAQPDGRPKQE